MASAILLAPALGKTVFWPPTYNNVTSDVEILSDPANLDGFKMNASAMVGGAFDFWYFDVASATTDAGVNIVFFNTGDFQAQLGNEQPLGRAAQWKVCQRNRVLRADICDRRRLHQER